MECFTHDGLPARGVCKSCGKALCRECIDVRPHGLFCNGGCDLPEPERPSEAVVLPPSWKRLSPHDIGTCLTSLLCVVFSVVLYRQYGEDPLPLFVLLSGLVWLIQSVWKIRRVLTRGW